MGFNRTNRYSTPFSEPERASILANNQQIPGYGGATYSEVAQYIIQSAQARGIDPNTALAVAYTEGLNNYNSTINLGGNQYEQSYGPFQANAPGGVGRQMLRDNIDPSNPANWKQTVDYTLNAAANDGNWNQFRGWQRVGGVPTAGMGPNRRSQEPTPGGVPPPGPGQLSNPNTGQPGPGPVAGGTGGTAGGRNGSRFASGDNVIRDLKCILPKSKGKNPLHDLSNYTYRLMISILDVETYNKFVSGQKQESGEITGVNLPEPGTILIASGGEELKKKNTHGVQDFYFKELILENINSEGTNTAATSATYALSIDFTLIEPLGTSLFERLFYAANDIKGRYATLSNTARNNPNAERIRTQIGAAEAKTMQRKGDAISLTEPIFLLTVEFKGYNMSAFTKTMTGVKPEAGMTILGNNLKNSNYGDYYRKFQIPFVFSSIDTNISSMGTEYRIKAYPAAAEVFFTNNQSLPATTQLTENKLLKETLAELSDKWTQLQANVPPPQRPAKYIFRIINENELPANDVDAQRVARTWRETTKFRGGNPVDASRIQFMQPAQSGRIPGGPGGTSPYRPSQNQVMAAPYGTTAIELLHQIMIRTDFIAEEVKKVRENKAQGGIWWFNIRGRMTFDTSNPSNTPGIEPGKIFEYIIEPFLIQVHNDIDQKPLCLDSTGVEIKTFRNYEYIFTGKNNDIIKWDLDYNGFIYTQLQVDEPGSTTAMAGQPQSRNVVPSAAGVARGNPQQKKTSYPTIQDVDTKGYSVKPYKVDWFKVDNKNASIGRLANYEEVQTSAFMESLWRQGNSLSQWGLTMEIVGDPEFMGTYDVFGNLNISASSRNGSRGNRNPITGGSRQQQQQQQQQQQTEDKRPPAAVAGQQILIGVEFKTPVDIDPRTLQYKGMKAADLNRIYLLTKIKNIFRNGKFTQELTLVGTDKMCCLNADGTRYTLPSPGFGGATAPRPD